MTSGHVETELVLDANVFVAGLVRPSELSDQPPIRLQEEHTRALPYILTLESLTLRAHVPRLCVVEICAVVRRRVRQNPLGRAIVVKQILMGWQSRGQLVLYDHVASTTEQAIEAALKYASSGADSLFIALAEQLGLPLKTFYGDILRKYPNASNP